MKSVFTDFYGDDDDPKQLVDKIATSLKYYGILRRGESICLQLKDIQVDESEDIEIDYPYATKRSARGFSPDWLKPSFVKYIAQFPLQSEETTSFLKNWTWSKDGQCRHLVLILLILVCIR